MLDKHLRDAYVRSADLGLPSEEYTLRKERHNGSLLHTHPKDAYSRHHLSYTDQIRPGANLDLPYRMPGNTANQGKQRTSKDTDRVLQEL
jgi:hypothetical protein